MKLAAKLSKKIDMTKQYGNYFSKASTY